ncbi:hypothetical protein Ancab_021788 [Ancistrocladus abbreviatus]
MHMGRNVYILLALLSLYTGLATSADWNILHLIKKEGASLKNYCESWRMNVELNNIRDFKVVPQECADFIGKYMTSTQYKADSRRAVEECKLYIRTCCAFKDDGKDAWIFDIDDTLISTLPYFKKHNFGGLEDEYKEVKTYKAEIRRQLVNEGYRIWGIIGDQWSSFEGHPSAKRTFKLPNSLYYIS